MRKIILPLNFVLFFFHIWTKFQENKVQAECVQSNYIKPCYLKPAYLDNLKIHISKEDIDATENI